MNKNELRLQCLNLRKNLDRSNASKNIVSKIKLFETYLYAKNVLIFYPMKFEINLLELLSDDKNFYLPRVYNDELLICPYTDNLIKSNFGVMEPVTSPVSDLSIIDIAFIPALCTDKKLNRLGYGKGYYDRLFSKSSFIAKKVGVIYKELVVDEIKTDSFDKKLDFLITD